MNVWPMHILLFFVNSPMLAGMGLAALGLILANIILQILVILLLSMLHLLRVTG
jgi:hypothetical protein